MVALMDKLPGDKLEVLLGSSTDRPSVLLRQRLPAKLKKQEKLPRKRLPVANQGVAKRKRAEGRGVNCILPVQQNVVGESNQLKHRVHYNMNSQNRQNRL